MKFIGSHVERTPDGARLKIRNRIATWVIIPMKHPESIRWCEFFMDQTGRVIRQNPLGGKVFVKPPYAIETITGGTVTRVVFPYPDRSIAGVPIETVKDSVDTDQ